MWLRESDPDSVITGEPSGTRPLLVVDGDRAHRATGALPRPLRILVHDFAGHPFQIDLSRALARRGHVVRHVYCESYTSGKGDLAAEEPNLSVVAVPAGE